MYIFPRLVGVITYAVVVLWGAFYIVSSRHSLKKKFTAITLVLSTLAFFFIPWPAADLSRHFLALEEIGNMTHGDFMFYLTSNTVPTYHLLLRIVATIGLKGLLPAIAAYFFYSNSFYILYRYSENNKITTKAISVVFLAFMAFGQFIQVISGIRNLLAFSILAKCIYQETVEGKKSFYNLPFYALSVGLHSSSLVIILIYLLTSFFTNRKVSIFKKMALVVIPIAFMLIFATNFIDSTGAAIQTYLLENSYRNYYEYFIAIFFIFLVAPGSFFCPTDANISCYKKIAAIILFISILNFPIYSIFQRFTVLFSILSLPLFVEHIQHLIDSKSSNKVTALRIALFLLLAFSCIRGDLSGYKFFL